MQGRGRLQKGHGQVLEIKELSSICLPGIETMGLLGANGLKDFVGSSQEQRSYPTVSPDCRILLIPL